MRWDRRGFDRVGYGRGYATVGSSMIAPVLACHQVLQQGTRDSPSYAGASWKDEVGLEIQCRLG